MDYLYHTDTHIPYENLALEECLVRHLELEEKDRIILIYRNDKSVVLGKNQNFYREINLKYLLEHNIPYARRISGGGTVVHDMGNINISIIENYHIQKVNNYSSTVGYVVDILNSLGIRCSMNERNAILLENGNKVSGSAQFSNSKKILTHFTLLYDSDIEFVESILKPNNYKIESKASLSHPSKVQNIKTVYHKSIVDFIDDLTSAMNSQKFVLNADMIEMTKDKYLSKYQSIEYCHDKANDCVLSFDDKGKIMIKDGLVTEVTLPVKHDLIAKRLIDIEVRNDLNRVLGY